MRIALGIAMPLQSIAKASGGIKKTMLNPTITHICTDSRELQAGDLFIAIKGEKLDGADYVADAREKGGLVLSSNNDSDIFHSDTRAALIDFASDYVKNLPYLLYRIGITGSVGKTTTKEFTKILLSEGYKTHASGGNYNNEIGMPMSILSAGVDTRILLMEMGMNRRGEIGRLSKCLRPNIGLITNIGNAHVGRLGSIEEIANAKLEILDGMGDGVLLTPKEEKLLSNIEKKECFSTTDISADYYIRGEENGSVEVYKRGDKICEGKFALTEPHHLSCLAAACAIAVKTGLSPEMISQGISRISNDNIRQSVILAKKYHFHSDCYNASPESMVTAIKEFQRAKFDGKKSLVLGDILELGVHSDRLHFDVGESISSDEISYLFLFGERAETIGRGALSQGFPAEHIFVNKNVDRPDITAKQIKALCPANEHILLKASRRIRLERILDYFKEDSDE